MARPLRLEFENALYHVTSRGDRREDIYWGDQDRLDWLTILSEVCGRFNWCVHAYCLMSNHYHLVVETPDANLSAGMRQLNGVYTQLSNRRYHRTGHVFQGRYKAILVNSDEYLTELCRYVVLNPVRAKMVQEAQQWQWSSYRYTAGLAVKPNWLSIEGTLKMHSTGPQEDTTSMAQAQLRYVDYVRAGVGLESIWKALKGQAFLGDELFVKQMLSKVEASKNIGVNALNNTNPWQEIGLKPRHAARLPVTEYLSQTGLARNEAILAAFKHGAYSMKDIALGLGLHYTTVSKVVRGKR